MVERICIGVSLLAAALSASAASSEQIVGSWKSDDGRAYAEIHLRADHSFTLFNRISMSNPELAVAEMAQQFGTWRVEGNRVKLDSTRRWSNERSQVSLKFTLANSVLRMQSPWDRARIDSYHRLKLPNCVAATRHSSLREQDLIGRWRAHYHTHDCQ